MGKARAMFNEVMLLEAGKGMLAKFTATDIKLMESMRTQLYRIRREFEAQGRSEMGSIRISMDTDRMLLDVVKVGTPSVQFLDRTTGEAINLEERAKERELKALEEAAGSGGDNDRQKKLMREEGMSEEEIEDYFSSDEEEGVVVGAEEDDGDIPDLPGVNY